MVWDEDEEVVVEAAVGAGADKAAGAAADKAEARDKVAEARDVKAALRLPALAVTAFAPVAGIKLSMP